MLQAAGIVRTLFSLVFAFFACFAAHAEDGQPKITVEDRLRYEARSDFNFSAGQESDTRHLYQRLRLGFGFGARDKADFFVEGLDARVIGAGTAAARGQRDALDLYQAYAAFHDVFDTPVDIKLGRQAMRYGKGRLIWASSWSNRIRTLDGAVAHYQQDGLWGDVLYGQDVKYDDNNRNRSNGDEFLTGFYGGYKFQKTLSADVYFLTFRDLRSANAIRRHTAGVRVERNFGGGWAAEIEAPFQFGHAGTITSKRTIQASAFHADVSKSWEGAAWKPKISLAYDRASGDKDPADTVSETFVPLYQSTHDPYGLLDLLRWQNMRGAEVALALAPLEKLTVAPQLNFFWLDRLRDAWYGASGSATRSFAGAAPDRYLGSEYSLRAEYEMNRNVKLEAGYAYFSPGAAVRRSGAYDNVSFIYTQGVIRF